MKTLCFSIYVSPDVTYGGHVGLFQVKIARYVWTEEVLTNVKQRKAKFSEILRDEILRELRVLHRPMETPASSTLSKCFKYCFYFVKTKTKKRCLVPLMVPNFVRSVGNREP